MTADPLEGDVVENNFWMVLPPSARSVCIAEVSINEHDRH
jgi:hypothetical protein